MVTFGGKPLFENLSFNIHESDRICLVGRNGAGKSTLMRVITGEHELDSGERWAPPTGVSIGYMRQEVKPQEGQKVFDFIYDGLDEERQCEEYAYMVDMVMAPLELNANDLMTNLSGGQMRRACLARSLVEEPDILLLDEPTNHLDLEGIEWLENYLRSYRGTLICISHDKTFLKNITNKIFWLDRGEIRTCPKGFAHFDEWSTMLLEQEERELARRAKIVEQEVEWASRGVKARVKRNVRRLENARVARDQLKADKSSYRRAISKVELPPLKPEQSSRVIVEFFNVSKTYQPLHEDQNEKKILEQFNFRVMRGDRIGILGKNGSGKTSFLKMLIGELSPDIGKVKLGKNINLSYFDQKRSDLDPEKTLWKTLCENGGDYVNVAGKDRHVCGYLKDFLFDPKNAKDRVATLSGGQRNRLLLAKILANPGNFLILDEPTNDLDMDTLEILEEIISHYKGTLFIVSHDRDFLDQTVTQILAFEGDAQIEHCVGGYSDYLEKKQKEKDLEKRYNSGKSSNNNKQNEEKSQKDDKGKKSQKKLSYKEKFELENLPAKIAKLEEEVKNLNEFLIDPESYNKDPEGFEKASRRVAIAKGELDEAEIRWLELEEIKQG